MLLSLHLLLACHPRVEITYLDPAEVTLPEEMRTVAVVSRVAGESAVVAVSTVGQALTRSPRLAAVDPAAGRAALEKQAGLVVGAPLPASATQAVCAATGATGAATLSTLAERGDWSHDSRVEQVSETQIVKDCESCEGREVTVTRDVTVVTSSYTQSLATDWDLYSCSGSVLDAVTIELLDSLSGEGATQGDAMSAAGDPDSLREGLARSVGRAYARHIAPMPVSRERSYYRGCGADMTAGHNAAQDGNWTVAREAWTRATQSPSASQRGKARYNLALVEEAEGHLADSVRTLRRARRALGDQAMVLDYLEVLQERRAAEKVLAKQLGPDGG